MTPIMALHLLIIIQIGFSVRSVYICMYADDDCDGDGKNST